jgi:aspartyl-tRNA(Asn)/glutamyl-tRNA(Gln) amidotransferase subunit A
LIVLPTVPRLPHKIGEQISVQEMYNYDTTTIPANLAEIPAMSIPAGLINKIPVGLQIMAPAMQESRMFSLAKMLE